MLQGTAILASHAVEASDDNGGNDELMRFDWNACFYTLCLSTVTTALASSEGKTTLTHSTMFTLRGHKGIITSSVSHGGSEA